MTFTYAKFFFIGFLFSLSEVQNAASQTYSYTNSASWRGSSPFKEFWQVKSEKDQGDAALLPRLIKLLTEDNAGLKQIENSNINSALANLNFNTEQKSHGLTSKVTLTITLTTDQSSDSEADSDSGAASGQNPTNASTPSGQNKSPSSSFDRGVTDRHNMYRRRHKVNDLTYSPQISRVSQEWANKLARDDRHEHRPNNRYGENIYVYWSSNPNYQLPPTSPVDSWYKENTNYDYSGQNVNIMDVGHFTQVVWKNSKELGVGMARSRSGKTYVVCNYSPRGNYIGQFAQNVLRP